MLLRAVWGPLTIFQVKARQCILPSHHIAHTLIAEDRAGQVQVTAPWDNPSPPPLHLGRSWHPLYPVRRPVPFPFLLTAGLRSSMYKAILPQLGTHMQFQEPNSNCFTEAGPTSWSSQITQTPLFHNKNTITVELEDIF